MKKWFNNLKIRNKLLLSFITVLVFAMGAGAFAVKEMQSINNDYSQAMELTSQRIQHIFGAKDHFASARMTTREIYYPGNSREDLKQLSATIDSELDAVLTDLDKLIEIASPKVKADSAEVVPQIEKYRGDIQGLINELMAFSEVSISNQEYRLKLTKVEEQTVSIGETYADNLAQTINGLSIAALSEVDRITAAESAVANKAMYIVIVMFMLLALITLAMAFYISGLISRPLKPLSRFMIEAGETGDMVLKEEDMTTIAEFQYNNDEIGQTIKGASTFIKHITDIAEDLKSVADGNLAIDTTTLSENDTMGKSMAQMVNNLSNMFKEIKDTSSQVSLGSKQIAEGSQSLAECSTEQASSVEELSASITEISQKTKDNAATADKASKLSVTIKENAEKGNRQMNEMIAAVADINEASGSIFKIIKTIDDIAFQTNILALNAAVEAARAGKHGAGFAVVAEEVRNLASKSAEAAKDTGNMIQDSMSKAEMGSRIAQETADSLSEIVRGINESGNMIEEIARASDEQSVGIAQIELGIDQVTQIIQTNSATAEESAAASEEMNSQSVVLEELMKQFKIKENNKPVTNRLAPKKNTVVNAIL